MNFRLIHHPAPPIHPGPAFRKRAGAFFTTLEAGDFTTALALLRKNKPVRLETIIDFDLFWTGPGRGTDSTSLLWACAAASRSPIVRDASACALALIAVGANVHARDNRGFGPLYHAHLDAQVLNALLDKGAKEPTALRNLSGVHRADTGGAHAPTEAVIVRILASGAIPADSPGRKEILLNFCRIGYDAPAVTLIAAGNTDISTAATSLSLLHYAAMTGSHATAIALLDKGAAVDALDATQRSALHIACLHRSVSIALLLIARGAIKDGRDAYNRTPSNYADINAMFSVVAALA